MRVISWPADKLLAYLESPVLRPIVPATYDGRIPSFSGPIMEGNNRSTRSKTYPSATLSTRNPTWQPLDLIPLKEFDERRRISKNQGQFTKLWVLLKRQRHGWVVSVCGGQTDMRMLCTKLNRYDRLGHVTHNNSYRILLCNNSAAMYFEGCGFKSRPGDGFPDTFHGFILAFH
jgi:hypothetical protein